MTNREQIAFSLGCSDYSNEDVARILCDMMDKVGIYICFKELERLEKWLGLDHEPETDNRGFFDWEE